MPKAIPLLVLLLLLTGCAAPEAAPKSSPAPAGAIPVIDVWVVEAEALVRMDVETYVAGVVAGEMPSDWPMEALQAQAILARTFVMKFLSEKESRYPGADISTDIAEAQAYDAEAVNGRILAAVEATRGEVLMTEDGALPYTWFHAHSGGMTETAADGIDWQGAEPSYTRVTEGLEGDLAEWTATFTQDEFLTACRRAGYAVESCERVAVSQKGESGRAVTLMVDGVAVNAARLRISLGSSVMRSTLLTELTAEGDAIRMAGRGYGHGVGMPQWGARALAEQGWAAEEIALHYYIGLRLVRAW